MPPYSFSTDPFFLFRISKSHAYSHRFSTDPQKNDGHFGELERMRHYKQDEKGCVEMSKFIVFRIVIKKYIFFMVVGKHAAVVLQTIAYYQIGGVKLKIIGEKLVENLL